MQSGLRNAVVYQLRNGVAPSHGWTGFFALPRIALDFGPSISGGHEQAHVRVASVRFLATSTTAPTKIDRHAEPHPAAATPLSEADALLVGLAQRYPNPDDIPDRVVQRIRNELFGRPIRPGEQTGRRALARPLQGRVLADWYFMPPSELPGFHNEEREYELSKALNRRHRKREAEEGEDAPKGKGKRK